uniref:Uncharacterized protein n=1 Tax=Megaviridae environmental sample TaxID=1737588 RepID=A0A5J6VKU1_9VIRU|nr:MAG: hypothetical protein [Megaviridae environmental sample]
MTNYKKCHEYELLWNICSSNLILKYYNSNKHDEYYKEMNICFKNYKNYMDCINNN